MDYDIDRLTKLGLDTQTGIGYTGGEDKYVAALFRFYKAYEKNRGKLEAFYEAGVYADYEIVAHALKSNTKMLGALELSEAFYILEKAAKAKDTTTLNEYHEATLTAYQQLVGRLAEVVEMDEEPPKEEIGADEARQIAEQLLAALDDFDDELAKELAITLSGYPFLPGTKGLLEKAIGEIEDFMYDEALALVKQVYAEIK